MGDLLNFRSGALIAGPIIRSAVVQAHTYLCDHRAFVL